MKTIRIITYSALAFFSGIPRFARNDKPLFLRGMGGGFAAASTTKVYAVIPNEKRNLTNA